MRNSKKKQTKVRERTRATPEEVIARLRAQIEATEARIARRSDPNYAATRKLKRLAAKLREEGADLKVLDAIDKL